ncbi:hypothetical protein [Paenibacillus sp. GXUN7292]|uniref:hypothetical protein n=1 Tax=Paenibacillus sp. GXUN7292 TaxID=3422499 RepID=UPI003D7E1B1C
MFFKSSKLSEIKYFEQEREFILYRIFIFLNYKMLPIIFEDKSNLYIDITLNPYSKEEIPINYQMYPPALHDLVVIAVRDTDNTLSKKDYVPEGEFVKWSRRTVNGVNQDIPDIQYKSIDITNHCN